MLLIPDEYGTIAGGIWFVFLAIGFLAKSEKNYDHDPNFPQYHEVRRELIGVLALTALAVFVNKLISA